MSTALDRRSIRGVAMQIIVRIRGWFSRLDEKTKKKIWLKFYQYLLVQAVILFLPIEGLLLKLGYGAAYAGHLLIEWLFDKISKEEFSSIATELSSLAQHTASASEESLRKQHIIAEGVDKGLQEIHEVSSRTANALSLLHETRRFDSRNNIHMVILRRISDKFLDYPCNRNEFSDILAIGIKASESWLGIHADSIAFFTSNPHAKAYSLALAERAEQLGPSARQLRLIIRTGDNDAELSDEAKVSEYLKATPGVKSFWMLEKDFKPKFRDLAREIQDDWALFDDCLVLHYDKTDEMMFPIVGGDKFDAMRRLFGLLRRRDEHNDDRTTIHPVLRGAC